MDNSLYTLASLCLCCSSAEAAASSEYSKGLRSANAMIHFNYECQRHLSCPKETAHPFETPLAHPFELRESQECLLLSRGQLAQEAGCFEN